MNTNKVAKVIDDLAEDSGFALGQALAWMQKSYDIGFKDFAEVDGVAAANAQRMIASGEAHIEARADLSEETCAFFFCMDGAGKGKREHRMFTLCLAPATPASNGIK